MTTKDLFKPRTARDKAIDAMKDAEDLHIALKLEAMHHGNLDLAKQHNEAAEILRRAIAVEEGKG